MPGRSEEGAGQMRPHLASAFLVFPILFPYFWKASGSHFCAPHRLDTAKGQVCSSPAFSNWRYDDELVIDNSGESPGLRWVSRKGQSTEERGSVRGEGKRKYVEPPWVWAGYSLGRPLPGATVRAARHKLRAFAEAWLNPMVVQDGDDGGSGPSLEKAVSCYLEELSRAGDLPWEAACDGPAFPLPSPISTGPGCASVWPIPFEYSESLLTSVDDLLASLQPFMEDMTCTFKIVVPALDMALDHLTRFWPSVDNAAHLWRSDMYFVAHNYLLQLRWGGLAGEADCLLQNLVASKTQGEQLPFAGSVYNTPGRTSRDNHLQSQRYWNSTKGWWEIDDPRIPWASGLESIAGSVREEFLAEISEDILRENPMGLSSSWYLVRPYDGWSKVFVLSSFGKESLSVDACKRLPKTCDALRSVFRRWMPNASPPLDLPKWVREIKIYRQQPGARIVPHSGQPGQFIVQMGLQCPDAGLRIRVGGEERHPSAGKIMIFEDACKCVVVKRHIHLSSA